MTKTVRMVETIARECGQIELSSALTQPLSGRRSREPPSLRRDVPSRSHRVGGSAANCDLYRCRYPISAACTKAPSR
jgi:hypothetical protein